MAFQAAITWVLLQVAALWKSQRVDETRVVVPVPRPSEGELAATRTPGVGV